MSEVPTNLFFVNREEIAWAAGFFDGEGSASFAAFRNKRGYVCRGISLSVSQADRRPLERFQRAVLGIGGIYPNHRNDNHTSMWAWSIGNWRDCQAVTALLWTFLSEPKRAQLRRVLARIPEMGLRAYRGVCPRGHPKKPYKTCETCRLADRPACPGCGEPRYKGAERCRACYLDAQRDAADAAFAAVVQRRGEGGRSWRHGTMTGYDFHGCRCQDCRAARAAKARAIRQASRREAVAKLTRP